MAETRRPRDVLVVGWYPGADDPIAGRFIADQAAALADTGRVRPWVASFEPFWLHGDRRIRATAASRWPPAVEAAAERGLVPLPSGAFGPPSVPVARLGTPAGTTPSAGRDNEVVHRAATLEAALRGMGRPVDLVHGHVGYPEGAAAARVAARLGVPFVLTEHATYLARFFGDPVFRARYREAGLAAKRIITVSQMLADQIGSELPELADRITIIPNSVDVASFPVVGPADRDADELLWVGYRREVKGTGVLLRAFAKARASRPTLTLRLVGRSTTDDEEAGWHALAAELGIADGVRFDGPADREGVVAAMSRAALFVHPGFRETFGVVAVEALASGLPVVATDSGGVTEVLGSDPDALGALVPVDDPEALASAILRVLDRRDDYDPARLREHVASRYAGPVVAGRIADLYDEVLAAHAAGPASRATASGGDRGPERQHTEPRPITVPRIPANPVLVAFDRPALDRLVARCPGWLLEGLVVVTRGPDVPGVARTVAIDPEHEQSLTTLLAWRSAGLPFPSPIRWLRRLRKRARLQATVLPALGTAVERAVLAAAQASRSGETSAGTGAGPTSGAHRAGEPDTPLVICLGGVDVVAAQPVLRAGRAALAPGGLRWLGDARWAMRGRPAAGAAADAISADAISADSRADDSRADDSRAAGDAAGGAPRG